MLTVREPDFVTASRALGESPRNVLFRRVLPNSLTPIIVAGTLGIAAAILEVAALSFLGLGPSRPVAGVGLDDRPGAQPSSSRHRTCIFFPGIALALTVLGFNLFGDGLRDALDPRLNR